MMLFWMMPPGSATPKSRRGGEWGWRLCSVRSLPTGANYQTVDEIPPSDTDYNETTIADKVDTFAHAALTGSPTSVKCVQVQARGKLIGSPTPVNLKLAINSGATLYLSPNNALNLAVKAVSGLWATDPPTPASPGRWPGSTLRKSAISLLPKGGSRAYPLLFFCRNCPGHYPCL